MTTKKRSFGERTKVKIVAFSTTIILAVSVGFFINSVKDQDSETTGKKYEDFDPKNFDNPTNIDNEWFPLKPWTQLVYEGATLENGENVPHRVVFTVTGLTKMIGGVQTVVCWDQDYSDGELVEAEIVFFAQDNDGIIWHLGQYPEVYEEGKFVDAPCWIHGIEGSYAGIIMKADPQIGTPSYSQGWAPSVDWTDRGMVYQMGQKSTVPFGSYEDVLVIDETSRSEPDAHQLKYYTRGVGNIRVGWKGEGEKTQEILELVKVNKLSPEEMDEAKGKAMELENNAYEQSKDVYGLTSPMEVGQSAMLNLIK